MPKFKPYYNYYMCQLLLKLSNLIMKAERLLAKVSTYTLAKAKTFMGSI